MTNKDETDNSTINNAVNFDQLTKNKFEGKIREILHYCEDHEHDDACDHGCSHNNDMSVADENKHLKDKMKHATEKLYDVLDSFEKHSNNQQNDIEKETQQLKNQVNTLNHTIKILEEKLYNAMVEIRQISFSSKKDVEVAIVQTQTDVLLRFINVLDILYIALHSNAYDEGIAMVVNGMESIICNIYGFKKISPEVNDSYNAAEHEAMKVTEVLASDEDKYNKISEVYKCGWIGKNGSVLRFAQVCIFKKKVSDLEN